MIDKKGFSIQAYMGVILALPFFFPLTALGQDFPTKPIMVYAGFEAGANTDLSARALAEEAQKELGVPVVVENKAGGGGTVAATLLAAKKPDGYTLAVTISEERVPEIPDAPTLKELGYKNVPPYSFVLLAPKGLPDPVYKKLDAGFRQAAFSSEFQKKLKIFKTPFVFKDRRQLEAEFPERYQFYADFLKELGLIKK